METRIIDAAHLEDIDAWERANKAKLLTAELLGDGTARAKVLPVADLDWWINVWNCKADLVIGDTYADELYTLDTEALAALTVAVVYEDHGAAVNLSGQYYPLSDKSAGAFARLMETAEPRDQD
jgi:hypothetical protein